MLGKGNRGKVAKPGLFSDPVVEDFNVFGDLLSGLFSGGKAAMVNEFGFEAAPATFHGGVVPAIAFSAHGGLHAELLQELLVGSCAVLAASV